MIAGLIRASYSTNIKDRRDASCAVYTADGDVIAMSEFGGTPLHLGTMHPAVTTVFESWPAETLEPGDAIIMNTPYPAGPGHLNDVCVVAPIFIEGELFAIAASQSHRVDVGGFAPGSMPFGVTEHFQEGLQITPMKIVRRGELDEHLLAFINQNLRTPIENRGDLVAQLAANTIAQRRIEELVARHGRETLRGYLHAIMDYSERRLIAGLAKIPPGVYSRRGRDRGRRDRDDRHRHPRDRRGRGRTGSSRTSPTTDPQVLGPINCRWPSVAACVYYVLKCFVDPELPANAGAYRPIEVRTKPGTVLEAQFPAAVCNANIITTQRIVDALLMALMQASPERGDRRLQRHDEPAQHRRLHPRFADAVQLHRDLRRRPGRDARPRRHGGRALAHDEHAQRAGRGDRGRVPAPGALLRPGARLRGARSLARRRRHAPRVRDPGRLHAPDRFLGSPAGRTRGARSAAAKRPVARTSCGGAPARATSAR